MAAGSSSGPGRPRGGRRARPLDFEIAGVSRTDAVDNVQAELPRLVAMLRGEELGDWTGTRLWVPAGERRYPC